MHFQWGWLSTVWWSLININMILQFFKRLLKKLPWMIAIIFRNFLDNYSTNINSKRMVSEVMNSSKLLSEGYQRVQYLSCSDTCPVWNNSDSNSLKDNIIEKPLWPSGIWIFLQIFANKVSCLQGLLHVWCSPRLHHICVPLGFRFGIWTCLRFDFATFLISWAFLLVNYGFL